MKEGDVLIAGFICGFLKALHEVIMSTVQELQEMEEDGLSDLGHTGRRKSALLFV